MGMQMHDVGINDMRLHWDRSMLQGWVVQGDVVLCDAAQSGVCLDFGTASLAGSAAGRRWWRTVALGSNHQIYVTVRIYSDGAGWGNDVER